MPKQPIRERRGRRQSTGKNHLFGVCPRCDAREKLPREAWDNGFRPLCKACGEYLQARDPELSNSPPPQARLRCALCGAFLRTGNPGPSCSPCERTRLTRGVHVLCVPRRIAWTDKSA
jgi:hypothetical protein